MLRSFCESGSVSARNGGPGGRKFVGSSARNVLVFNKQRGNAFMLKPPQSRQSYASLLHSFKIILTRIPEFGTTTVRSACREMWRTLNVYNDLHIHSFKFRTDLRFL